MNSSKLTKCLCGSWGNSGNPQNLWQIWWISRTGKILRLKFEDFKDCPQFSPKFGEGEKIFQGFWGHILERQSHTFGDFLVTYFPKIVEFWGGDRDKNFGEFGHPISYCYLTRYWVMVHFGSISSLRNSFFTFKNHDFLFIRAPIVY